MIEGEKPYERTLGFYVKQAGGLYIKQTGEYFKGLPDRLIVKADGTPVWVEFKSPGKKPNALQLRAHEILRSYGHRVWVIDSSIKLEEFKLTELEQ